MYYSMIQHGIIRYVTILSTVTFERSNRADVFTLLASVDHTLYNNKVHDSMCHSMGRFPISDT